MWKKPEPETSSPTLPRKTVPPRPESLAPRKARIGPGLLLKGELSGQEDVIIEGRIEGKITLENNGVIVEETGRVDADIVAHSICVAGEVHGNLFGSDQVVLLKTGRVEGNIEAKSVTLETGAQFKGSIDMDVVSSPRNAAADSRASTKPNDVTHRVVAS